MPETNQLPPSHDDFRKIKGIGSATAQALYQAGIRTYQDLAQMTPSRLVELLKSKIPAVSLRRIEKDNWPAKAQALIDENDAAQEAARTNPSQRETWRELADFFISFGYAIDDQGNEVLQTKAHHSQADKLQQWDGAAANELLAWILKQADLPEAPQSRRHAMETSTPAGGSAAHGNGKFTRMTLSDVCVNEITPPADPVKRTVERLLRIETLMTLLDDVVLDQSAGRVPYSVEVYLVDVQTSQAKLVNAYSNYLFPGDYSYPISQDITIPETGRYQVIVLARLLPPLLGIAQAQGPLLRVEV